MIDLKVKELRNRLLTESDDAIARQDMERLNTLLHEAEEKYQLDLAGYIGARKLLLESKRSEALELLDEILKINPQFPPAHICKVVILVEQEKYEEAIAVTNVALQSLLMLSYELFHHNKGVAYERLGKSKEARFCFLHAIEDNPKYKPAYAALLNLAARAETSEEDKIREVLYLSQNIRQVFKEDGEYLSIISVSLLQFAETMLVDGKQNLDSSFTKEAMQNLEVALKKTPLNPSFLYNFACANSRVGNHQVALDYLEKTIEIEKSNKSRRLAEQAANDKDFRTIRENPRFKEIVA